MDFLRLARFPVRPAIVVYDPALETWVELETALDQTNRKLCAVTTHLSVFASAFEEFALATPVDYVASGTQLPAALGAGMTPQHQAAVPSDMPPCLVSEDVGQSLRANSALLIAQTGATHEPRAMAAYTRGKAEPWAIALFLAGAFALTLSAGALIWSRLAK